MMRFVGKRRHRFGELIRFSHIPVSIVPQSSDFLTGFSQARSCYVAHVDASGAPTSAPEE